MTGALVNVEVDVEALASEVINSGVCAHIQRLEDTFPGLSLMPYAGLDPRCSMLAGGRLHGNNVDELINLVERLNADGIPFAVALSGSVSKYRQDNAYNQKIDLRRDPVYPLLLQMVEGNQRHQLRNSLTILRDDLLEQLDACFPDHNLEVWASCIRFVGQLGAEEYQARLDRALSLYDAVVIDNPSTERVLIREREPCRTDRLVIFLNSKCAIDSQICNAHYANIERGTDLYQKTEGSIKEMLERCQKETSAMISRPEIISLVAERGIKNFKWQRGSSYSFGASLLELRSCGLLA